MPRVFKGDRTATRLSIHFFVVLLLFVGAVGLSRTGWASGPILYGTLEALSSLLAMVAGALALVRFYSKKQETFLLIGTGFVGTGFLDLFPAVLATGWIGSWTPEELEGLATWSFTASGAFLSLFLLASLGAWWRLRRTPEKKAIREVTVYLTALLLAVVIFAIFDLFPLRGALRPDRFVRQPAEFVPGFIFLLAAIGYLVKGHWRVDAFEHWLVVGLLLGVMAHGAYMPFSSQYHDALFVSAHAIKVLSYATVLVGLLASVYLTFRREEEVADATREANTALAREIDFRRRAERVIQESEARLQDFLDNAHDLIQSVDQEGRFVYVNRAWKKVLGYSDDDLEGLSFFDILDPGCRRRCEQDFARVTKGGTASALEVDFVAKDGRIVQCSGSANVWSKEGEPVVTRSIFRDTTEQLQARRKLEGFQANLRALVENTGDAIWSVDRDKRLITFNTAFSMAMEVRTNREPKVGDPPETCLPPQDVSWYGEMYERALSGETFSELRDERIGGQVRSYEFFFNPIREAAGITGVAAFGQDVTARRRTQLALRMAKEEAEQANQAKSQFLASMSHELRTPLNSVIGFTNILLKNRSGKLAEQELSFLDRIVANGKHLLELINEVLDLAKIEAGRMELDLAGVELDSLVGDTLLQMEGQVRAGSVTLREEVPRGLDPIMTDGGKLKQVIINLVGNALKFTKEGEVVVEVLSYEDGRTPRAIAVRDTGIGIPPHRLQAIFEAFQQADGTTNREYGGTGLGLTISRSLCQLLGFDLRVESEVGKGSTFTDSLRQSRLTGEAGRGGIDGGGPEAHRVLPTWHSCSGYPYPQGRAFADSRHRRRPGHTTNPGPPARGDAVRGHHRRFSGGGAGRSPETAAGSHHPGSHHARQDRLGGSPGFQGKPGPPGHSCGDRVGGGGRTGPGKPLRRRGLSHETSGKGGSAAGASAEPQGPPRTPGPGGGGRRGNPAAAAEPPRGGRTFGDPGRERGRGRGSAARFHSRPDPPGSGHARDGRYRLSAAASERSRQDRDPRGDLHRQKALFRGTAAPAFPGHRDPSQGGGLRSPPQGGAVQLLPPRFGIPCTLVGVGQGSGSPP